MTDPTRLRALFDEAVAVGVEDRAAFLDRVCDDEALRREVERLLEAHERSNALFDIQSSGEAPQMALAPGDRLGSYEIVSAIGAGGMGQVYRAFDLRLQRDVAIKVLPEDLARSSLASGRFEREARVLAKLHHPHICTIFELGESSDHRHFIVMELLEGETLQRRLTRGPMDVSAMVDVALGLADALDAAHHGGVIHRDIKPANIFISSRGPKLLDFGLVKATPRTAVAISGEPTREADAHPTTPGTTVGTVAYMSPEQLRGQPLDARTDLFSFGLVLYQMAVGRPAFSGETGAVVSAAILHQRPVAPRKVNPSIPESLEAIVLKALEKDREDRYQTAADLRADLRRLKRDLETRLPVDDHFSDAAVSASDSVAPMSLDVGSSDSQVALALLNRHRTGALLSVAALVVILVAGVVLLRRSPAQSTSVVAKNTTSVEDLHVIPVTTSGVAERPAISPDGKFVAYIQRTRMDSSLWVRQIATNTSVEIVPSEPGAQLWDVTVTPDGNFVNFVRLHVNESSSLWRVPFLGGVPKRILDNVWSGIGWSPDGRRFAFVRSFAGSSSDSSQVVIATVDGASERVIARRMVGAGSFQSLRTVGELSNIPSWSPDGRLIAVTDNPGGGQAPAVDVIDAATGAEQSLPVHQGPVNGVAWLSNDALVVANGAENGAPVQLWRLTYPDGRLSRLTNDLTNYAGVSVTADQSSLVSGRIDRRAGIWVGDATGNQSAEVVNSMPFPGAAYAATVTWAGDRLVYTTSGTGRFVIATTAPGLQAQEELVSLAAFPAVTGDGRTMVFWKAGTDGRISLAKADSVDGRHLTMLPTVCGSPRMMPDNEHVLCTGPKGGFPSPWLVSTTDNRAEEIVHVFAAASSIDVSHDGRSIAFSPSDDDDRPGTMIVCDLPHCAHRKTFAAPSAGPLRWTPDDSGIAYVDRDSPANIWIKPLDGAPRQLTHFTDRTITDFDWSRDGRRLAIYRTTTTNDVVLFKGLKP